VRSEKGKERSESEVRNLSVLATSNTCRQKHCSLLTAHFSLVTFLFSLFSIIFSLSSCGPLGFLGKEPVYDTIWAEPKRLFYNVGEIFVPGSELSVYASYRNFTEEIPLSRVELSMVVKPGNSESDAYVIPEEGDFRLDSDLIGKGRKQVVVTLTQGKDNLATSYNIMIDDPGGLVRDDDEEDPDGGGIGIIWKDR